MHIILMLALVIAGLSLMGFSTVLGAVVLAGGLACFRLGSDRWREEQEALFFSLGLLGMVAVLGINVIRWLFSI